MNDPKKLEVGTENRETQIKNVTEGNQKTHSEKYLVGSIIE